MKHIIDEVPRPARQLLVPLSLLLGVLVVGMLGFRWIEGTNFFDSFYMALITLTTVGYEEHIELSKAGRVFNSLLILAGFTVVFVALGMLSHVLLQLELYNFFEQRKSKRMIQKLSDHYIVCGLGRVGRGVIEQLRHDSAPVIAIDNSADHSVWAREHGVPILEADATLDETLERAGARRARGLVAAIGSDAQNVYITLSARGLNPDLRIVARAADEAAKNKLLRAGCQAVCTPYTFTGRQLAQALLRPQVSNFLDIASALEKADVNLKIEEYHVHEGDICENKTLADSGLTRRFDVIVLAVTAVDGSVRFNPSPSTRLRPGDVLIVMGRGATLEKMQRELAG